MVWEFLEKDVKEKIEIDRLGKGKIFYKQKGLMKILMLIRLINILENRYLSVFKNGYRFY